MQPALVELLARQCMGSPKWTAREWRLALAGGGGGRGAARLLQGGEGGEGEEEDEEGFGRLADALSFRSEAVDAAESMASGWPEVCGPWCCWLHRADQLSVHPPTPPNMNKPAPHKTPSGTASGSCSTA